MSKVVLVSFVIKKKYVRILSGRFGEWFRSTCEGKWAPVFGLKVSCCLIIGEKNAEEYSAIHKHKIQEWKSLLVLWKKKKKRRKKAQWRENGGKRWRREKGEGERKGTCCQVEREDQWPFSLHNQREALSSSLASDNWSISACNFFRTSVILPP